MVIERLSPDAVMIELDQERLDAVIASSDVAAQQAPSAGFFGWGGGEGGGAGAGSSSPFPSLPYALASASSASTSSGYGADFISAAGTRRGFTHFTHNTVHPPSLIRPFQRHLSHDQCLDRIHHACRYVYATCACTPQLSRAKSRAKGDINVRVDGEWT